jgi:predicted ester cyclase
MTMAMYQSMPDLHLTIEDMVAKGDNVMCRNIWRWTEGNRKRDGVSRFCALAL